jgi:TPR repeat protein
MLRAQDFEKLGSFYLGRVLGPDGAPTETPLLYDAKDLTTHAVCLGMTGSGKTGLCIALLEEAAIDGIPALAIDPKGDLGNLLLTFPALRAEDFAPWVDPAEAARNGQTPAAYAASVAERWRKGLADWGEEPSRIQALRDAAELALYTPGSSAGRPLRLLRSFEAPPAALAADADGLRERLQATVAGLLALLGLDADPVQSRESVLLQNVVAHAWNAGRSLELAELIRAVQSPPFERVGVFDLETFYPAKERGALALRLNNLLASPSFGAWREGDPLDIAKLLYTPAGRPRLAVLSIAHLSEGERMFFVTSLLSELVAWMRAQPGTESLRAVLYMDEIFGYFPPTANPPSKPPMLTLLKQARAHGLGVVLATQNPVDLDYKGLANTGTWFLGRLQTERDKARVLEGLEGASAASGAAFDRGALERTLAGLGARRFLLHNVHEDAPVCFESRWALSYLRGPLSREQIRVLCAQAPAPAEPAPRAAPGVTPAAPGGERPQLAAGIEERFFAPSSPVAAGVPLLYEPALLATASVRYVSAGAGLDSWQTIALCAPLTEDSASAPWESRVELPDAKPNLESAPQPGARFAPLPALAARPASYPRWSEMLETALVRDRALVLRECKPLRAISLPGESEGAFRVRLADRLRESRDQELERLRKAWAPKLAALEERVRRARERTAREQDQYASKKLETAVSIGASVLGALFGRKLASATNANRAASVARSASRAAREREDVTRAEETAEVLAQARTELEAQFQAELERVRGAGGVEQLELTELRVAPRKSDVSVDRLLLAWIPRVASLLVVLALGSACAPSDPVSQAAKSQLNRQAMIEAQYKADLEAHQKKAAAGEVASMRALGEIYFTGTGVPPDHAQAARWYTQAAERGDVESAYRLGVFCDFGTGVPKDPVAAVRWLRKAAEAGHAKAQSKLAAMLAQGRGATKDDTEASRWYLAAAEQGEVDAQSAIALRYDTGLGIAENASEAMRWYRAAAQHGSALDQYQVGFHYDMGIGVKEDDFEAEDWYLRAANDGNLADAQYALGVLYSGGARQNPIEACKWLEIASRVSYPGARRALQDAQMLLDRREAEQCHKLAEDWIARREKGKDTKATAPSS